MLLVCTPDNYNSRDYIEWLRFVAFRYSILNMRFEKISVGDYLNSEKLTQFLIKIRKNIYTVIHRTQGFNSILDNDQYDKNRVNYQKMMSSYPRNPIKNDVVKIDENNFRYHRGENRPRTYYPTNGDVEPAFGDLKYQMILKYDSNKKAKGIVIYDVNYEAKYGDFFKEESEVVNIKYKGSYKVSCKTQL